jgi:hypothetical protein
MVGGGHYGTCSGPRHPLKLREYSGLFLEN